MVFSAYKKTYMTIPNTISFSQFNIAGFYCNGKMCKAPLLLINADAAIKILAFRTSKLFF